MNLDFKTNVVRERIQLRICEKGTKKMSGLVRTT